MTNDGERADEAQPEDRHAREDEITRRRFVAGGVALGATIVWAAPFPFADAPIGQILAVDEAAAADGPTGPTGPGPAPSTARIRIDRRVPVGPKGRFTVTIACDGTQTLTGKAILREADSQRKLGKADFTIPAGEKRRVKIQITRSGLERLERRKKISAEIVAATPGNPDRIRKVRLILL